MAVLPISNIINVSITTTPSGLQEKNVNSLALFTTETPTGFDAFTNHVGANSVAGLYGTSSVTYQMASAIFSQSPNLRTGDGGLVVIPYLDAVSATQGYFTTASLAATLEDILLVSNGDIKVTVDGVAYNLTKLNFTGATNINDVATILNNALLDCIITASGSTLIFTSKKVGADSDIVLAAVSGGTGTDMSGAGYFNVAAGTATSGVDASGETLIEAIVRTEGSVGYVPVITNLEMEDDVIEATADAIQALDRMWLHHGSSTADIAGIGTTISDSADTKTRYLLYTESPQEANLFKAAYAGRAFSVNFNGTSTSQSMNIKQLATITPDNGITQTLYNQANIAGVDLYVSYDGVNSVLSSGGNDFFDNVYNDLALKFALETAGFNFLRQTNTKVPQTESGLDGLKAAYSVVLRRFVRINAIAAGSWTSSERFGDPEIFDENILNYGYYVYSIPITEQSSVEREAREAPLIQIAVKRAGAIHTSDVIVLVND